MIATVSPGASYADHTLNTLRYGEAFFNLNI